MKANLYRNFLVGAIAAIGLLACPFKSAAVPLTIGDGTYVGSITDGIPPSGELQYINYLITLAAGTGNTQIPAGTGEIYNRVGSSLNIAFPTAVSLNTIKEEDGTTPNFDNVIDATGYLYVLGKYDAEQAGSLVWYLGPNFVGEVTLPETFNGKGLSHISLYNYSPTGVPDGGATLALLGIGLVGLDHLRRRFMKA